MVFNFSVVDNIGFDLYYILLGLQLVSITETEKFELWKSLYRVLVGYACLEIMWMACSFGYAQCKMLSFFSFSQVE